MIPKDKYLVYNKETDRLDGITDLESKLILNLSSMPEFKFSALINEFYDDAEDKALGLERIEEIFYCYYTSPRDILNPFTIKGKAVIEKILKIIDEKKQELRKASISQQGLESILNVNGKRLFEKHIRPEYLKNRNPQEYAMLWMALKKMKLTERVSNQTKIHLIISNTFGGESIVGTRQAFNANVNNAINDEDVDQLVSKLKEVLKDILLESQ